MPRESCISLYNAMILPIFDYCAVIWDSCNKANRDYLDKLHRRAASISEGHKVSQSQVSRIFSWPSLQSRRDYLKCMLVFKCLNNLAPPYLINLAIREISIPTLIHATEICSVHLLQKQQNIRAPLGSVVLRFGIPYRWT